MATQYTDIAPKYTPFTFQELMLIPSMYKESYESAMKEYNEVADKAATIRAFAKDSPEAAQLLQDYDNGVKGLAEAMATGRWNSQMATDAMNLREAYRKNIIPINAGVTAYQAALARRDKKDDGTLIGNQLYLDDYIKNPNLQDNFVLGSTLQKDALTNGSLLSQGIKMKDYLAYQSDPTNPKYAHIAKSMEDLRAKYGYDNMSDDMKQIFDDYLNVGINQGMLAQANATEAEELKQRREMSKIYAQHALNAPVQGRYLDPTTGFFKDAQGNVWTGPKRTDSPVLINGQIPTDEQLKSLSKQSNKKNSKKTNEIEDETGVKRLPMNSQQQVLSGVDFSNYAPLLGTSDMKNATGIYNVYSISLSKDAREKLHNAINTSGSVTKQNEKSIIWNPKTHTYFYSAGDKNKIDVEEFDNASYVNLQFNPLIPNILELCVKPDKGGVKYYFIKPESLGLDNKELLSFTNLYLRKIRAENNPNLPTNHDENAFQSAENSLMLNLYNTFKEVGVMNINTKGTQDSLN